MNLAGLSLAALYGNGESDKNLSAIWKSIISLCMVKEPSQPWLVR